MLRCTYIVLINDNQNNIARLIDSLKKINGNFRKEFIIVDDGSKDDSLGKVKQLVNDLPRTTIITQETLGPSISINKALSLATGDYIHFIDGGEITHPRSTEILIAACKNFGADVAFGRVPKGHSASNELGKNYRLVQEPIKEILDNKLPEIRNIGKSGSIVCHKLLEKIGKADSGVYTQNMSLSLRCAKYSKFVFVDETVSVITDEKEHPESKFESYNTIKSIYNFAKNHPEICTNLVPLLLKTLSREATGHGTWANYSLKSLLSKYVKTTPLGDVLALYKTELDKLF
jgi:glycosyltransferase involved in cell wall biosynthesis